jgi:hypothetical protein
MRIFAVALAALLMSGGSRIRAQSPDSTAAAVTAAQAAAISWLGLVDRGRYGDSWDSAAVVFRRAVTRSAWEAAVGSARRPFEPFGERQQERPGRGVASLRILYPAGVRCASG